MDSLKRSIKHSFQYMSFQVLGMSVSFISFPIITRIFSVEDYGNLALATATLGMLLPVAKCGFTTSFIRYYPEAADTSEKKYLYSSTLGASIVNSLLIIFISFTFLFFLKEQIGPYMTKVFVIIGFMVLFRNLQSLFSSFFRAEEKVKTLSLIGISEKLGSLTLGILIYSFFIKNLYGYFIGTLIFEAFLMSIVFFFFYQKKVLGIRSISVDILKKLYLFGFPLIMFEISSMLNDYSDRFIIKYFLDSISLAVYSVGYNFSMYLQSLITAPLWMAIFPIYTKLWKEKGHDETAKLLEVLLKYYFCIAILIVFGVSLLRNELITFLATKKYSAASHIIPFIISSVMINGTYHITGAGFFLAKKTSKIAGYTLISAILNIILNLYLVPKYNILGAAYATVVSYALLTLLITVNSNKLLKVAWPVRDIIFYLLFALIMAVVLIRLNFGSTVSNLILKSVSGLLIYISLLFFYDKNVRKLFSGLFHRAHFI